MNVENNDKIWIIQRCIDAWTNHYEDWPGYCEHPMTRDEMVLALEECGTKWPNDEFRGHNIHAPSIRHKKGEYPRPIKKD
jgi:hypothetical protein